MTTLRKLIKNIKVNDTNIIDTDVVCSYPESDSLKCNRCNVFVAIKGNRFDGHDFICTAVEHGASFVVCERVTPYLAAHPEIKYLTVDNSRLAYTLMWSEYCDNPASKLILVAVTGTNGKTSTTYFLREIFKSAGYFTGVIGTVKCLIGDTVDIITDVNNSGVNSMTTPSPDKLYPELAKMAESGVEIVFIEASSHALSQYRLDALHFDLGVFTGLTNEHLDYHISLEDYYDAKKRLFSLCENAVINVDGEFGKRLCREISIPKITYGRLCGCADYMMSGDVATTPFGSQYCYLEDNIKYTVDLSICGAFMAENSLAAIAVARLFGIKHQIISDSLKNCPQISGRMERIVSMADEGFEIYIDYAHTPDALEKVLTVLLEKKTPEGRLIAVFGCGGDRDKTKRPIMCRIATTLANLTIVTRDNSRTESPRAIIYDIIKGAVQGADCKVIEKREDAITYAITNSRPGDIILLAGKGHEDYYIDDTGKHPFSEAQVVKDALKTLHQRKNKQ